MYAYFYSVVREIDPKTSVVSYVALFKSSQSDEKYNLTTMRDESKERLFARCVDYMHATLPIQPDDYARYFAEWKFLVNAFEKLT